METEGSIITYIIIFPLVIFESEVLCSFFTSLPQVCKITQRLFWLASLNTLEGTSSVDSNLAKYSLKSFLSLQLLMLK